jgi:cytochrome P450
MMDLFSDGMRRNPYPVYDQMRSGSPVFHLPPFDLWMIFDFEGVKRALVEHSVFSSDLSHVPGHGNPGEWFIFFDAPRHTKLRALISKAFTPRVVANLELRIRELSRQLLDQAMERGEMDLAADFAVPLPMLVIAEMLDVPAADWPRYKRWSDVILKLANTFSRDEEAARTVQEYRAVTAEMRLFLPDLIAQRRMEHQEDLLTRLVEAEVDGERLTQQEILGFVQLLLVGGQETTANLINNAVLLFPFLVRSTTADMVPSSPVPRSLPACSQRFLDQDHGHHGQAAALLRGQCLQPRPQGIIGTHPDDLELVAGRLGPPSLLRCHGHGSPSLSDWR